MQTSSWEIKNSLYKSAVLLMSSNNQLTSRLYFFYYYLYCNSAGSPLLALDVTVLELCIYGIRDTDWYGQWDALHFKWKRQGKKNQKIRLQKTSRGHLIHIWMCGRLTYSWSATATSYFVWFIDGKLRDCVVPMKPSAWLQHKWKFNPNLTSPGW